MADTAPKLFISYSWTSPEHQAWVLDLATSLREDGVDVILDKWDLKEGQDAFRFMEQMVSNPEVRKVAILCDRGYVAKATERAGGVGAESQIISPEIYAQEDQAKFVVVVAENDERGKPCLPPFYLSRIYIDLSDNDLYATNYEQLLRWVFDRPLHIKPALGAQPSFLSQDSPSSLGTTSSFRRTLEAIRNRKDSRSGALVEYFERLADGLETLRLGVASGELDDRVVASVADFLPYRNETVEIFLAISRSDDTPEAHRAIHRFFERSLAYLYRPADATVHREAEEDNFRFVVHEPFLYAVASLLKYDRFDAVGYLLRQGYYLDRGGDRGGETVRFSAFRQHMKSLEHRNQRLNTRRLSLRADLLHERAKSVGMTFQQLMQADFTLYIRDCLDCLRSGGSQRWYPETLLYSRSSTPFEIYARSRSRQYFESFKQVFDISDKQELGAIFEAHKAKTLGVPRWDYETFDPPKLMGYDQIGTQP